MMYKMEDNTENNIVNRQDTTGLIPEGAQNPAKTSSVFDVRLYNIVILGIAFMLLFSAFQTCSVVEESVIQAANITGSGYTSLAVIYGVFSASNWLAPSIISIAGPQLCMIIGSFLYFLFVLSFLKPMTWALYLGSVLVGFGAAILWTSQGAFLTTNSDSETIGRNSGIFWAIFQCSLLVGNLYTYFVFRGNFNITDEQRIRLFAGLSVAALVGSLMFLLLRRRRATDANNLEINASSSCSCSQSEERTATPLSAIKGALRLFKTREMLLLSVCFAYTGFELTFFIGVYGTCIGNTGYFGDDAKGLIGISGMLIGAGEILGGTLFGLFGKRINRYGRDPIVLLGFLVHCGCFFVIFINMPNDSPINVTDKHSYIKPNEVAALACSFMLGFGDASYNTQIFSILGGMYPSDSAAAFALFKFVQSVAAAVAFFYSSHLLLEWQLLILVIWAIGGSLCFFIVEWKAMKEKRVGVYGQI